MKLKQLQEKRGGLVKEARQILDTATGESRAMSADEAAKFGNIESEIEGLGQLIDAEVRQLSRESAAPVVLSEREERDLGRFDFAKVLNHLHRSAKGSPSQIDGFEAEMIAEGEREARAAGIQASGILLPRVLVRRGGFEQRDMTATGGTGLNEGGMTISTEKRGLADDFFNASVLRQNGALVLEGLSGNLDLPRLIAGSDPAKKSENGSSDEVSPTTGMLSLRPRRLPAHIDISDQLLRQSSPAIEAFLRVHLTNQMAAVQERAFFHGGGTDEPTGIAATVGIGSVVGGTNGAAPDWADIIGLETQVDLVNAAMGNLRYFANSKVRGKLKATPKVSSTDSRMILEGAELNGYGLAVTNAIKSNLTKGSATSVCSAIFFGNANDFVIGYWGGVELEMVRDKTNAITGLHTLVASTYYDGGVLRPKSFAAMLDALTA